MNKKKIVSSLKYMEKHGQTKEEAYSIMWTYVHNGFKPKLPKKVNKPTNSRNLGFPVSTQILPFINSEPVSVSEICKHLNLSSSSIYEGIKCLLNNKTVIRKRIKGIYYYWRNEA